MNWFIRVSIVSSVVCGMSLVMPSMAEAGKGGRGGGRGGIPRSSSRANLSRGGPSGFHQSSSVRRSPSANFSRRDGVVRTSPIEGRGDLRGKEWALDRQRAVAERNLEKRYSQAEHLRGISERNGNERLLDTADRMEQRSQTQYERRTDKINSAYRDLDIPPPPDNGTQGTSPSGSLSPTTSPTTTNKSKWTDRFTGWWPFGRSAR